MARHAKPHLTPTPLPAMLIKLRLALLHAQPVMLQQLPMSLVMLLMLRITPSKLLKPQALHMSVSGSANTSRNIFAQWYPGIDGIRAFVARGVHLFLYRKLFNHRYIP